MTTELITGITELVTNDEALGVVPDAAVVVGDGTVAWVGRAADAPAADRRVDLGGRAMLPGWVDSHTHLVFAGDRSAEFVTRMAGGRYEAGGIRSTVEATRAASDEALRAHLERERRTALAGGTTTIEIKTGYGLDVEHERRSAALAAECTDEVTFLGAHVVPPGIGADDYVDLVTGPMLAAVRPHARWIDVFCERGAFDREQSRAVLDAGRAAGLGLRVHGNQLGESGGVALAVELGAASVDHCNHLDASDLDALAGASTVATLLPACDLSTREPFAPARALVDAGATIALASNCNPGSSNTSSMAFCVATAVLQMRLTIDEAVRAATLGGAMALGRDARGDDPDGSRPAIGVIRPGASADPHALEGPGIAHLAYRPGMPQTHAVWWRGERVV